MSLLLNDVFILHYVKHLKRKEHDMRSHSLSPDLLALIISSLCFKSVITEKLDFLSYDCYSTYKETLFGVDHT